MKHLLRICLPAVALALPLAARAQNELSNFSATGRGGVINTFAQDYQALGINPANLGRAGQAKVAFSFLEVGAGLASQTLNRSIINKITYNSGDGLTAAGKAELRQGLTGADVLNVNFDVSTLALAVSLPNGLGSIAFSNRQRVAGHLGFNSNAADVIVNGREAQSLQEYYRYTPASGSGPTATAASITSTGKTPPNVGTFLDGTQVQVAWTSEYNLGYGVQVLDNEGFKLSVGLGYRYIQGIGIVDIKAESGELTGFGALSPLFKINYGTVQSSSNFNYQSGGGLNPVGRGNGFDLGLAAEIGKAVRVGASLTDLGSMTWDGNVLTAKNQSLQQVNATGLSTYNVFKEISNQFSTTDASLFKYEPAKERKADLPAKLRLGGGIRLSELFEAGLDVTLPLNKVAGNLTAPFVGLGLDYKPVRWLRLSSGFTGGAGYGKSLPLGLTFVTSIWESGISTRDVVGLLSDKSPYNSVALGFLRFKIGGQK